jgi:hypothetical protein
LSPAEKNDVRSTTQGSPAGAHEDDSQGFIPHTSEVEPPTVALDENPPVVQQLGETEAQQTFPEPEPKIDGFTSPLLPGVVFAEGYFPARERMRRIADAIIKVRPDLKDRFLFHSSVFIPLILLGWVLWTTLLGLGSTVSASTSPHLPRNVNGSHFSSFPYAPHRTRH